MTILNSTISDNRIPWRLSAGGGIYNSGVLSVADTTLAHNVAGVGSGIATTGYSSSQISSIGSIFSNPTSSPEFYLGGFGAEDVGNIAVAEGGTFRSLGRNLFTDAPAVALDATDLIGADPLLGPLADNGGPTWTMALLPGSPAVDAGAAVTGVAVDQRGVTRPKGAAPDIGAYEAEARTPAFEALAAPTIVYATAATVLSGRIAAGGLIPAGEVAITLGGATHLAAIDPATGAFASVFTTSALHVSSSRYLVAYRYAGSGDFAAVDGASSLTVLPGPLTVVADDRAVPFGAEPPPTTASYVGFVDGDGPASLAHPVTLTTAAEAYSPPGAYPMVASGAASPDYAVTFVHGTLVVAQPAGRLARRRVAFVTKLYRDALGRAAEPAGLRAWLGRLDAGVTTQAVARRVWASPERLALARRPAAWGRAARNAP
nr:choice-of-anchor Q domain-containing protein [Paludisphaera mucosa]